jgi:hypothetical protein
MDDRPALKSEVDGEEIEITLEMEKAGGWVIADRYGEALDWEVFDLAREVYRVMTLAYDGEPRSSLK